MDDTVERNNECELVSCFCCTICKQFLCKFCVEKFCTINKHSVIKLPDNNPKLPKIRCRTLKIYKHDNNDNKETAEDVTPDALDAIKKELSLHNLKLLNDILLLLPEKENELWTQLDLMCTKVEMDFKRLRSATPLDTILDWSNLRLCIDEENIVKLIAQNLPYNHQTVTLGENDVFSDYPFGKLETSIVEVAIRDIDDSSCFSFTIPDRVENMLSRKLLKKVKELFQNAGQANLVIATFEGKSSSDNLFDAKDDVNALDETDGSLSATKSMLKKELLEYLKRECQQELNTTGFLYVVRLIENEELDYLKLLLSVRPDILQMHGGEWGGTPTIIAAQYNKLEIMQYLLTHVQQDDYDKDGDTILHHAAFYGSDECITWLCKSEYKRLINAKNKDDRTPLHWAVYKKNTEAVSILCKHGADFYLADSLGETALDLAHRYDYQSGVSEIMKEIRRRGGKKV